MADFKASNGALDGVRIVDVTSIGMGPFATQMLGDMGADVIKVEITPGDVFRHVSPQRHAGMSHAFLNLNRNKRSVELDLKSAGGIALMLELISTADVFVSNMRPRALARLGLDHAALSGRFPRLIHCGCYGYGEGGPYSGRPSVDDTIQAACGVASLQAYPSDEPRYVNNVIADKVCGLYVANAIAMALLARQRTGLGQSIEVPMFECMVAFTLAEHLGGLTFVPPVGAPGYARLLNPYRRPFRTRTGFLAVVPYTDAQWARFFEVTGRQDLVGDGRFSNNLERSKNIEELYALVDRCMAERSSEDWVSVLEQADIPFSVVNSMEDLVDDPHLNAVGFWHEVEHPTEGKVRMIGMPVKFSGTPPTVRRLAPSLGEHNGEIRAELKNINHQRGGGK